MFERFTESARASVVRAQQEAGELRHDWIGTEHLLLGLLGAQEGPTAAFLLARGLTLEGARAEVERRVGRGDADLDPAALATLGIDLEEVRRRVEATFGPGALARRRGRCRGGPGGAATPFSARAKRALELSVREAVDLGAGVLGDEHLLLGLLREGEGVAAEVLGAHGVDHAAARRALGGEDRLAG
jgi:ATP-dependent Clp protease ATP-binding subunit ClpA